MSGGRLAGQVALVTGSGRNIGRAIALAFAREGADLVLHARTSRDEIEAVAVEVRAVGRRAVACLADVRDAEAIGRVAAEAERTVGPISVLVNSAALRREQPFEDLALDEWREVLSVMLDGAFVCSRAVLPGMLAAGRGAIINVIGLTGQSGAPRRAHVVTGKAGLIGFTKALALEYAGRGIRVNGVSPGMIETSRGHDSSPATPSHHAGRAVPLERLGRPEDVAAACVFLASDEACFITGQILAVNGGTYL